MTSQEYWAEVNELAAYFADSGAWREDYGEDIDRYDAMHETVDGHQYIIYYSEAADVLRHTDNPTAYEDELGDLPDGMTYQQMACPLAFMAMMADINSLCQQWGIA